MTADGEQRVEAEDQFECGYWVVFARGLEAAELLRRLGPGTLAAEPVRRLDIDDIEGRHDGVAVRAGSSAGWAYGVMEAGPVVGDPDAMLRALSAEPRRWAGTGR